MKKNKGGNYKDIYNHFANGCNLNTNPKFK